MFHFKTRLSLLLLFQLIPHLTFRAIWPSQRRSPHYPKRELSQFILTFLVYGTKNYLWRRSSPIKLNSVSRESKASSCEIPHCSLQELYFPKRLYFPKTAMTKSPIPHFLLQCALCHSPNKGGDHFPPSASGLP